MSADMPDVARYIEFEAGRLIREARAERDKAWREVEETHAASRQKDEQIRKLTRDLRAAEERAKRARMTRPGRKIRLDRHENPPRHWGLGNERLWEATREAADWELRNPSRATISKRRDAAIRQLREEHASKQTAT